MRMGLLVGGHVHPCIAGWRFIDIGLVDNEENL